MPRDCQTDYRFRMMSTFYHNLTESISNAIRDTNLKERPAAVLVWRCAACNVSGWVINTEGVLDLDDGRQVSNCHYNNSLTCFEEPEILDGFE